MRAGALAAVSLVAAGLGAAAVLVLVSVTGWMEDEERVRTVVVATSPAETGAAAEAPPPALAGSGFQPSRIYASRSPGVVTIYATFAGGRTSQGSGFVASGDGHVLTNSHVLTDPETEGASTRGADSVYVVFADGDRVPASIVGWDLFNDTGVVKVDPADHATAPLPLGDSNGVVVGEPVAAIGSPFGQEGSLSVGVVSATRRSIDSLTSAYAVADAIQIDAPINHGNSGGPLLDARGRVIGINAQIRSTARNGEGGGFAGVGFAIPINSARRSMEQLVANGRVAYAYVGVTTQDVTPSLARRFGFAAERGALIQSVVEDAPAARARLRGSTDRRLFNGVSVTVGGDLIVRFAGEKIERAADIARIVTERLRPGQTVPVTVVRGGDGRRETVRVTLVERPLSPPR